MTQAWRWVIKLSIELGSRFLSLGENWTWGHSKNRRAFQAVWSGGSYSSDRERMIFGIVVPSPKKSGTWRDKAWSLNYQTSVWQAEQKTFCLNSNVCHSIQQTCTEHLFLYSGVCTCACTHTQTHTRVHAHAHTQTHTLVHAHAHTPLKSLPLSGP